MLSWFNHNARAYVVTADEWEARCQWDDLTQEEQSLCCSGGCGLELWGLKVVPDFQFQTACCRHDFGYLRGGDERVRQLVDRNFKEEVRKLARETIDGKPRAEGTWIYKRFAELYAGAVAHGGWISWRYGPMNSKERIMELAKL